MDRRAELNAELLEARQEMPGEQRELMDIILKLPPRYRMPILLHYYQDLSVEEVARALGLSTSAVYYRLNKARGKLRGLLEGENDG